MGRVCRRAFAAHEGYHSRAGAGIGELRAQASAGERGCCPIRDRGFLAGSGCERREGDFIFMDLDKPMYAGCYTLIMEKGLLAPDGIMLCDNVLYRGLTAQHYAGEMPSVSGKTAANAAAMDTFL